jgi:hypothetical protein
LFFSAWGVSILVIGMYALIQRRIELYDDCLVVVQGRGGNRHRYADISSIMVERNGGHSSLIICLRSGRRSEVFLSADVPLLTICRFLLEHGVECVEKNQDLKEDLKCGLS